MLQCHHCGAAVSIGEPIPRDAECGSCRHDLRCCVNCRHYDTRYNNSCRETMADPVEDKSHRNFCEYFDFSRQPFGAAAGSSGRESAARARLDQLFGGKGAAGGESGGAKEKPGSPPGKPGAQGSREDEARAKLDRLFRKPQNPGPAGK